MEAAIISAAAGLTGVAVGAVLQPWLNYWLAKRQRLESRTEELHRELREMIVWRLDESRTEETFALTLGALLETGWSVKQARAEIVDMLKELQESYSKPLVWQPYRIPDQWLREMCEELNKKSIALRFDALAILDGRAETFNGSILRRTKEVGDLQKRIVRRLDDLRW